MPNKHAKLSREDKLKVDTLVLEALQRRIVEVRDLEVFCKSPADSRRERETEIAVREMFKNKPRIQSEINKLRKEFAQKDLSGIVIDKRVKDGIDSDDLASWKLPSGPGDTSPLQFLCSGSRMVR